METRITQGSGVAPLDVQRGVAPACLDLSPSGALRQGSSWAVGIWAHSAHPSPPVWSCAYRGTKSNPDEVSFLYTLPGDSTHQLLQTHQDCHHLQEQPATASQSGVRSGPQSPGLEATWDPLFHAGPCEGQGRELKRLEVT